MSSNVITVALEQTHAGFTQGQFRKLDQLYCAAMIRKAVACRSVECDFDDGVASYTYYVGTQNHPYLQFVIRRVGPRATMFEVYKHGQGRIAKSGIFDRAYEILAREVDDLAK